MPRTKITENNAEIAIAKSDCILSTPNFIEKENFDKFKIKNKKSLDELTESVNSNTRSIEKNLRSFYSFADMTSESVNTLIDRVDALELRGNIIEEKIEQLRMDINVMWSVLGIAFCGLLSYIILG